MAIFFKQGENKNRPGLYQRHTNVGFAKPAADTDGICAIPVQANWGPLGKVLKNSSQTDLRNNYGSGAYASGFTVPAASAMFDGKASVVYTYRMGTGGKAASLELDGLTVTAKYPGTMPISVAVQEKIGNAAVKQFLVYNGTAQVELWEFNADTKAEGANLIAAVEGSNYITVTGEAATVSALAVASGALTGGENPTVTNEDYSKAFAALEPFYFNCIALDVDDDKDMTLSLLLKEYLQNAYLHGKLGSAVVGQPTTVQFATRLENAMKFNDPKVVFLGSGYKVGSETKNGVLAICYTAGAIASTPSNQSITHAIINGATELCETLTFAQYESAISSGMLMMSMANDGTIWYDSGVNTLTTLDTATQDEGWKKIRRTKTRFEMISRIDRVLNPKVGRVSADSDGIADIIQSAQGVLNAMVTEGKLLAGATFIEDPDNPHEVDSAHFIIQSDDIDSLEMIYLQYQFRYSQNS